MGENVFVKNVTITLPNKGDVKEPQKREDYWRRAFKTYSPFRLKVEDGV